jgi:multimeric flavodoxin WrbA
MVLMVDTTTKHTGKAIAEELLRSGETAAGFELIDTTGLHISHCAGCNYCWLKTPGVCVIQDDYEPILRKMSKADQVWLISDTHFGFVSWQTKNIVDRIMPLVTMYLKFRDGQMRHVMRYDHQPDIGIIYTGDGDQAYLERWCGRTALNFGSSSLGVFPAENRKEAVLCML